MTHVLNISRGRKELADSPARAMRPQLQLQPVVRLLDGEVICLHASGSPSEERAFRRSHPVDADLSVSVAWLAELLAGALRNSAPGRTQVSVLAPKGALSDRAAPAAAAAVAAQAGVSPSRIRIDFPDLDLADLEETGFDRLDAFQDRGFKVGLDASEGWQTPLDRRARGAIKAVWLDAARTEATGVATSRITTAALEGMTLIARSARWREAGELASRGIHYAMTPAADG